MSGRYQEPEWLGRIGKLPLRVRIEARVRDELRRRAEAGEFFAAAALLRRVSPKRFTQLVDSGELLDILRRAGAIR